MRFNQSNKGNSIIVILIVIAILAIGGVFYYKGAKNQKEALEAPLPPPSENMVLPPPTDSPVVEIGAEDEMLTAPSGDTVMEAHPLKEFDITGKNYVFSLKEIRVKKGDFVHIKFISVDSMHDWRLDEFNAATAVVTADKSSTVEFVANKAGTFEFYCSVGNHRQMGMVGKLIVE